MKLKPTTKDNSPFDGCLYYTASALGRIVTRMAEEEFAATGLSPSYVFLLMIVHGKPGIQPTEIAEKMMLTPSTVTRLIEKLEYQGYLRRRSEGRATLVEPTEKSLAANDRLQEAWAGLSRRYGELLGEETARKLTQDIYEAAVKLEENATVTAG